MTLPPDILARVERVLAYHRASKYDAGQPKHQPQADPEARPVARASP